MYALELGGENDRFAAAEAGSAATGVEVVAPGLATATTISDRVRTLAYTHRASDLLGRTDADVASAKVLLEASALSREGTVAVRVRDVRETADIDTQQAERELGQILVDTGFEVDLDDPDHELRALFSNEICLLGWLETVSIRDYGTRKPTDRPFFQPGGMDPLLARALVNLAGARPGTKILDPMCGTGGVLIEAGLVGATVYGTDAQRKMARGAAKNLDHFLDSDWTTMQGDGTHLPFPDDSLDGVVFDAPYGRQSKIANLNLDDLVAGALEEARRVAKRAVVVGDRSWADAAREAGWEVADTFERRVHRSLDRYIVVLD